MEKNQFYVLMEALISIDFPNLVRQLDESLQKQNAIFAEYEKEKQDKVEVMEESPKSLENVEANQEITPEFVVVSKSPKKTPRKPKQVSTIKVMKSAMKIYGSANRHQPTSREIEKYSISSVFCNNELQEVKLSTQKLSARLIDKHQANNLLVINTFHEKLKIFDVPQVPPIA